MLLPRRQIDHDTEQKLFRRSLKHAADVSRGRPSASRMFLWLHRPIEVFTAIAASAVQNILDIFVTNRGGNIPGAASQTINPSVSRLRWLPVAAVFAVGMVAGAAVMSAVTRQRKQADDIVVVVQGAVINASEFNHRLELHEGAVVLNELVREKLLGAYAHARHKEPSLLQVRARAAALQQQPALEKRAWDKHLSDNDLEQMSRLQLTQEMLFGANITASDAEVRAYYRAQTDPSNPEALYFRPASARIQVITTPNQAAAEEARQAIIDGASFAAVAQRYSVDRVHAGGRELPPIVRGRSFLSRVPALENAVFEMQQGQTLAPFAVGRVWWIIQCNDKEPASTIPFETVKAECRKNVITLKGIRANAEAVATDFDDFCRHARVQVFWERYYNDIGARPYNASAGAM